LTCHGSAAAAGSTGTVNRTRPGLYRPFSSNWKIFSRRSGSGTGPPSASRAIAAASASVGRAPAGCQPIHCPIAAPPRPTTTAANSATAAGRSTEAGKRARTRAATAPIRMRGHRVRRSRGTGTP
jgi:hypothetical protein